MVTQYETSLVPVFDLSCCSLNKMPNPSRAGTSAHNARTSTVTPNKKAPAESTKTRQVTIYTFRLSGFGLEIRDRSKTADEQCKALVAGSTFFVLNKRYVSVKIEYIRSTW